MFSFGKIIKNNRTKKGYSVRDLIKVLNIKLSTAYITKIELHGEIPTGKIIKGLARALDLDEKELLDIAKEEKLREYLIVLNEKFS
jgi:transcriptional regulator with XRE-family HTH domain